MAPPRALTFLALAATLLFAGCAGRPLQDPPEATKELQSQDYEFETVWEVSLEAMRRLEFRVRSKERSGDDRNAVVISEMRILEPVAMEGTETAERLTIEIQPSASSAHRIVVSASQWKRSVTRLEGPGYWEYVGVAPGLHDKFQAVLEEQFSKRYRKDRS